MTGAVLLIGVGTMAVLGGIVTLTAMLLGIRLGSERGSRTPRKTSRYEFQPIHAVAVIAGLVALLLTRWVAIGVGVAGAVVLVPSLLAKSDAQQQITRLEALGSWTRRLGDLLASGAASSLDSALVKSAAVAPAAITSEVGALAARIGPQGSQAALMAFAKEMADPISDEVVMSLILQQRHGGRGLAAVLADLAAHVEDQIRMRREVEADRAKPRSNVRTIVLLTLGLSGGLILFDRTYLAPYGTVTGQLALAGVVAIFAAAVLWLRRMIRQMPGERLLVDADFAEQAQR
jgi:tight adherence protein B